MTKRRSILDLKHKLTPLPRVARRQLENGRWQAAIMFHDAIEPLVFDRPTEHGLENEITHQCRKRACGGNQRWDALEEVWNKKPFYKEWESMTCLDCGGRGSCPFCSSTGKVYRRKTKTEDLEDEEDFGLEPPAYPRYD